MPPQSLVHSRTNCRSRGCLEPGASAAGREIRLRPHRRGPEPRFYNHQHNHCPNTTNANMKDIWGSIGGSLSLFLGSPSITIKNKTILTYLTYPTCLTYPTRPTYPTYPTYLRYPTSHISHISRIRGWLKPGASAAGREIRPRPHRRGPQP